MKTLTFKNASLFLLLTITLLFQPCYGIAQSKTFDVDSFDKVIVSPHIEVTFKKGDTESVVVTSSTEPLEKINVEVKKGTLELFLTDAEMYTKSEKESNNRRVPMYKGTVINAVVTYKDVKAFSLRGEERFFFESPIDSKKMELSIYGASQVQLSDVTLKEFKVAIYGESVLKIDKGDIDFQQIRAYGESSVNLMDVNSKKTKLTAYGDGSFQFNASEELNVTSYGEPTVTYKGDAKVKTGLSFGESYIVKIN